MTLFSRNIFTLLLGSAITLLILTGCHDSNSFNSVIVTTASNSVSSNSDTNKETLKPESKTESKAKLEMEAEPESEIAPLSKVQADIELWEMDYDTYFSQERKFKRDVENILNLTIDGNKIIQNHTQLLYEADEPVSDLQQSQNRDLIFFVKGIDTKTICRLHLQSGKMNEILSLDSKIFQSYEPETNDSLVWWTQDTPEWTAYIEAGGDWELPPKDLDKVNYYRFNSKTGEQKLIPESEYDPYEGEFEGVPHNSAGVPIIGEDLVSADK